MPPWPPIVFASSPARFHSGCSYCSVSFWYVSPWAQLWKLFTPSAARRPG